MRGILWIAAHVAVALLMQADHWCAGAPTPPARRLIVGYTVTTRASQCGAATDWAAYVTNFSGDGTVTPVAFSEVNGAFPETLPLLGRGFSMPFMQFPNTTQLYVSPNGFVSPSPSSMCPATKGFCSGPVNGWYKFSAVIPPTGGGDWPMIAAYAGAMAANRSADSGVRVWVRDDATQAIVDYAGFNQVAASSTTIAVANNNFTGQLHLFSNGTIVVRYASFFRQFAVSSTLDYFYPSVGVLGYGVLRGYGAAPSAGSPLCASRLEPVFDPCGTATSCSQCVSVKKCVWCWSTQTCLSVGAASVELCAAADASSNASCVRPSAASTAQQYFYAAQLLEDDATLFNVTETSPFVSRTQQYALRIDQITGTVTEIAVPLPPGVSVPYFDFPTGGVAGSGGRPQRNTTTLYVHPTGPVVSFEPITSPLCGFDDWAADVLAASSSSSSSGGGDACVMPAALPFAVLPYTSPRLTIQAISSAPVTAFHLRPRPLGAAACNALIALTNASSCGPAVVIELGGVMLADRNPPSPPLAVSDPATMFILTLRVLLTSEGFIAITVYGTSPLPVYPAPLIAIQGSASGGGGASLPWAALSSRPDGASVAFVPIRGCPDCRGRGYCNATSGACICASPNFIGAACQDCAPGFYGQSCAACPDCNGRGACDSGIAGLGICACQIGFGGEFCETTCRAGAPTCSATDCTPPGGYCDCGTCRCRAQFGWYGPQCASWRDPCSTSTLDGCAACVARRDAVVCLFCNAPLDYRCVSSAASPALGLLLLANSSKCITGGTTISNATASKCPRFDYNSAAASATRTEHITVVLSNIGMGAAGVILIAAGLIACGVSGMYRRSFDRTNPLVRLAVRSVVYRPTDQRSIVVGARVFNPPPRTAVHGHPLKQVPLAVLFDAQQQCRTGAEYRALLGAAVAPMPPVEAELEAAAVDQQQSPRRRRRRRADEGGGDVVDIVSPTTTTTAARISGSATPGPSSSRREQRRGAVYAGEFVAVGGGDGAAASSRGGSFDHTSSSPTATRRRDTTPAAPRGGAVPARASAYVSNDGARVE